MRMTIDEKLSRLRRTAPSLFMLRGSAARRPTLSATPEQLDDILRRAVARERVELEMSIIAFEQTPGVANRNFVRFAESSLPALAASGANTPYLADHRQNDVDARLGSVTKSTGAGARGGAFQVRQTVRVTAPAAVERLARGLTTAFSIGWYPLGDVLCSVCGEPVLEACLHLPGDKLEVGAVEWVTTSAELIETSEVGIPGVREVTRIEEVRALSMLAADLGAVRRPKRVVRHDHASLRAFERDQRMAARAADAARLDQRSDELRARIPALPAPKEDPVKRPAPTTREGQLAAAFSALPADLRPYCLSVRHLEQLHNMYSSGGDDYETSVRRHVAGLAKAGG